MLYMRMVLFSQASSILQVLLLQLSFLSSFSYSLWPQCWDPWTGPGCSPTHPIASSTNPLRQYLSLGQIGIPGITPKKKQTPIKTVQACFSIFRSWVSLIFTIYPLTIETQLMQQRLIGFRTFSFHVVLHNLFQHFEEFGFGHIGRLSSEVKREKQKGVPRFSHEGLRVRNTLLSLEFLVGPDEVGVISWLSIAPIPYSQF